MPSSTYVFAYLAFAIIYLMTGTWLTIVSVRAGSEMAQGSRRARTNVAGSRDLTREYIGQGAHLVDYAQLATLLPLAYILASIFLGSAALRAQRWTGAANALWVALTLVAIFVSVVLALRGIRRARRLAEIDAEAAIVGVEAADAARKIAGRLAVSAILLGLAVAFTTLNLWSVLTNLNTLLDVKYVL